jgi:low temperature requirement protein LtrA
MTDDSPPRLTRERHATWLELFFDLVFVLAVAQLGRLLHASPTPEGFRLYALLFVPVWWVWTGFSYYADLFDSEAGRGAFLYRIVMFFVMLDSIALAVTLLDATTSTGSALFALIYAALRLLLVLLYGIAAWQAPQARDFALRHAVGFGAGAMIWLLSLAVPPPTRYAVWTVALAVELATPIWAYLTTTAIPVQRSHMPERFGLFALIVLGDAIVIVGSGVDKTGWSWPALLTATFGFAIAFCLWWLYFARFDEETISRAAASASGHWRVILHSFAYGYGHLLIYAGITATGVGIAFAIEGGGETALAAGARAALCGGLAVALLGMAISQTTTTPGLPERVLYSRLDAFAVLALLGLVGGLMPSPLLVALIAALCVLLVWRESESESR